MKRSAPLAVAIVCALSAAALVAQSAAPPVFPNAPAGFDTRGPGVAAGRVERIEYKSTVTGTMRPAIRPLAGGSAGRRGVP
jgi:hypothetical protein